MGIKNFSKAFKAVRTVKYKDLKGQKIAIDAMTEIYRAALGAKSVATLTDAHGNPTMHINVILAIVNEMHRNNIRQVWVFDHDQDPNSDFHNPMKLHELAKRKKRKEIALEQIKSLADVKETEDALFSDMSDSDEVADPESESKQGKSNQESKSNADRSKPENKISTTDRIQSLEKQTFHASKSMINDVKYILTCLNIQFIEAPKGFEGEAIASYLNKIGYVNAVFSGDTDPIAYGALRLLRRNPRDKLIYEYTQKDVLEQIANANEEYPSPTLADFHKAAMALGTDTCAKTKGVGPATVLKKLHTIELTDEQLKNMREFTKEPIFSEIKKYNDQPGKRAFVDCKLDDLINWLVVEKSFNRARITNQLNKAIAITHPVKKTRIVKKVIKVKRLVKSKKE